LADGIQTFDMYLYIKALHIIFVVTWFSGMFYIVRLFIYNTEAGQRPEAEKKVLRDQFGIMIRLLWRAITMPSAVLTAVLGISVWSMLGALPGWLMVKLAFVAGLYLYHFSLYRIYREQMAGVFRYSSQKLRIWNEVATIFLVSIVMIVVVKQSLSWIWGLAGLLLLMVVLMSAIRIYKMLRKK